MSSPDPITNPYAPPASGWNSSAAPSDGAAVTPAMTDAIRRTRPWVLLFAVLAFVSAGLCALGAIGLAVVPSAGQEVPPGFLALLYVFIAMVDAFMGVKLLSYSGSLEAVCVRGDAASMEHSLDRNRSLWLSFGIITIVSCVGLCATGVVAGITMAANGPRHATTR
jgi:hypothetical protein